MSKKSKNLFLTVQKFQNTILGCQKIPKYFFRVSKIPKYFFRVSKNSFFFLFTDGKVQILKGNFSPNDVHHQFGIALTTPAFPHFNVTSRVEAQMYLHKKSDGITSIPVPFYFCPNEDQKKPIITATRSQTKRDRNAVKMENVVQEESTGRIAAPPQRFKSGGGSVMTIGNF